MAISNLFAAGTFAASRQSDRLQTLRSDLADLNRQLATGQRHETLGAMRRGRSAVLDMRADLGALDGYRAVAKRGAVRIGLMSDALGQLSTLAGQARTDGLTSSAPATQGGITTAISTARMRLDQAVSQLNTDMDGQYLFSGRATGTQPVLSTATLLNGAGGAAGLTTLIDERRQADRGDGMGRLTLGVAGPVVSLTEEAAGLPFGFKLSAASSTSGAVIASGPGGTPAGLGFTLTGPMQAGETLAVDLTLPDGSSERIALQARPPGTSGPGGFVVGADAASMAANIGAALTIAVRDKADSALAAASSMVAADDFFASSATVPARRVAGPPFSTATGFAAAGSRATLVWYQGDDDPAVSARGSQLSTIDKGVTLGTGARANEGALRKVLVGLAAVAGEPAAPTAERYRALAIRSAGVLAQGSDPAISTMTTELATAGSAMGAAEQRHANRVAMVQGAIGDIEQPSIEELSASILALQTRLQASYQVTASISKLSLAQYL